MGGHARSHDVARNEIVAFHKKYFPFVKAIRDKREHEDEAHNQRGSHGNTHANATMYVIGARTFAASGPTVLPHGEPQLEVHELVRDAAELLRTLRHAELNAIGESYRIHLLKQGTPAAYVEITVAKVIKQTATFIPEL